MQPEFASSGEELEFVDVAATLSLHVVGAHGLPYAGITMDPLSLVVQYIHKRAKLGAHDPSSL